MEASVSTSKAKVKTLPVTPKALLRWYDRHRRVMPWRALPHEKPDPYRVWISEIMLQQTTVVVVQDYFKKFIARWPTVKKLAVANRDDVLRMWAGLGYYRRAHLLHDCAQKIATEYKGKFPETEHELLELPGIGPYTAAAIASIAFERRANVVDGNVERVIARVFNVTQPLPLSKIHIRELADQLVPSERCGDYAQALMDLGATICTPRNPKCPVCPWKNGCEAYKEGTAEGLPKKVKKTVRPTRYATAYVVVDKKGRVLMQKRPLKGLLGGMLEVPTTPWDMAEPDSEMEVKHAPLKAKWQAVEGEVEHVFSHFNFKVKVKFAVISANAKGLWLDINSLGEEALPSIMRKIVRHGLSAR